MLDGTFKVSAERARVGMEVMHSIGRHVFRSATFQNLLLWELQFDRVSGNLGRLFFSARIQANHNHLVPPGLFDSRRDDGQRILRGIPGSGKGPLYSARGVVQFYPVT